MQYWLLKSEPGTFSIDDLAKCKNQIEPWNGVRNYQVRNMMRDEMKVGDLAFFYHSSCKVPGIVGIVKVVKEGYPDDTAFDVSSDYYDANSSPENPRWYMVDVKLVQKFKKIITLDALRANPKLDSLLILRQGNRLSITPVAKEAWEIIVGAASV